MEDLSDRGLERFLQENNTGKWFCGFELSDRTPDHTAFFGARARIGAKVLSKIFKDLKRQLQNKGFMSEMFTFVDAIHLAAIKMNHMKHKNKDLDSWISSICSPYERVFAHRNKRVRYSGIAKNQFAAFMQFLEKVRTHNGKPRTVSKCKKNINLIEQIKSELLR